MSTCPLSRFELFSPAKTNIRLVSLGGPLLIAFRRFHTTKTKMVGARVDLAFAAGADDITRAILFVAKK